MKRKAYRVITILIIITLLPFGLNTFAQTGDSDLILKKLNFDGLERSFYLHLPSDFESHAQFPVLLILHGGGKADGDETARRLGYNILADRERFLAVYPNGVDAQWNDGRGKSFRRDQDNSNVDDVGFLATLIDHLIHEWKGDPNRVYVTGLSNGGMMTLRLGCEIGFKLAAIAPIIANMPVPLYEKCASRTHLPVLLMNGTEDPFVPLNGGKVTVLGKEFGDVVSTKATVEFWIKNNDCDSVPNIDKLPDLDPDDGTSVIRYVYHGKENSQVVLYKIIGGGHSFPADGIPNPPHLLGKKCNDINGPEIVWKFLKNHKRNGY